MDAGKIILDFYHNILFFDSIPCKTMKMKLTTIGRNFEREKIVFKNQNIFFTVTGQKPPTISPLGLLKRVLQNMPLTLTCSG